MQYARARTRGVPHLACGLGLDDGKRKKETCNSCRDFVLRKRLSTFAAVNETSPPRPMDRTAAYEAADGSSSLPEGTMEPWQRWSMRGTENPENEVRVLGVPPKTRCLQLRWKSAGLWLRWPRVGFPSDTHQRGYSSAGEHRTVNPWAGGSNPSIPAKRSGGEAVNAPVCKTGIRRSESGSELRTLSWLNR